MKRELLFLAGILMVSLAVSAQESTENTSERWGSIISVAKTYATQLEENGYDTAKVWNFIYEMDGLRAQLDFEKKRGGQENNLVKHFQHAVYKTRWELKQIAGNDYTDLRIKE